MKAWIPRALQRSIWIVTVVGVGAVLAQVGAHVPEAYSAHLRAAAWVLLGCFIVEQALRLWLSEDRRGALSEQLLDLSPISSVRQAAGSHTITKAQSHIKFSGYFQQAVILLIKRVFPLIVEHPAN